MNKSFTELAIAPPILQALEEMGFARPTPVQSKAIPYAMAKSDLIVIAKTGSGKTAAFGIPMLQTIDPQAPGPRGLILTPTRELAVQVDHDLHQLGRHLPIQTTVVYGQHNMNVEIEALNRGASIVTGTPGRVYDHIRQKTLTTKHIEFLVLDEADRMLDMGFIDQVQRIIKTLPQDRVTMLFSATIPQEIRHICQRHMRQPETIEIPSTTKTVDTIEQLYYRVERNEKRTQLNRLLRQEQPESCLIFCNTRNEVDRVQEFLARKGFATCALHGEIPQAKRLKTIHGFKSGRFHLLVATDVAARGIHVDDLALVINYDVPNERDNYIHRIGRTGRAGNGGKAITLVTGEDIMSLYEIEEHINAMIREEEPLAAEETPEMRQLADAWMQSKTVAPEQEASPRVIAKKPLHSKAHRPGERAGQGSARPKAAPAAKTLTPGSAAKPTAVAPPPPSSGKEQRTQAAKGGKPRPKEKQPAPPPSQPAGKKTSGQSSGGVPRGKQPSPPGDKSTAKPPVVAGGSKISAGTGSKKIAFAGKKAEAPVAATPAKKGLLHRLLGKK